jgi:hypothetical protein
VRSDADSNPVGQFEKLSSGGAGGADFLRAGLRLGLAALSGSGAGKGNGDGDGNDSGSG